MSASFLMALLAVAPVAEVSLQWNAPEHCPAVETVIQRIAEMVGRPLNGPPLLSVTATIATTDRGDRAMLAIETAQGTSHRTLDAPKCAALADAVAVIVALALDSARAATTTATATIATEVPRPEPRRPRPVVPGASTPRPASRRGPVGIIAGATIQIEAGALPGATGAARALAGAVWWRFSLEVGVVSRAAKRATVADGAGVDLGVTAAVVRGCYAVPLAGAEVGICVGGEIGTISVESFSVQMPARYRVDWRAATVGINPKIRLWGPISAVLSAQAAVLQGRPTIIVNEVDEVYTPNAIAVSGGIGIEVLFL